MFLEPLQSQCSAHIDLSDVGRKEIIKKRDREPIHITQHYEKVTLKMSILRDLSVLLVPAGTKRTRCRDQSPPVFKSHLRSFSVVLH